MHIEIWVIALLMAASVVKVTESGIGRGKGNDTSGGQFKVNETEEHRGSSSYQSGGDSIIGTSLLNKTGSKIEQGSLKNDRNITRFTTGPAVGSTARSKTFKTTVASSAAGNFTNIAGKTFKTTVASPAAGNFTNIAGKTFKTTVASSAAGNFTKISGKAIIYSANQSMIWNNRQYYWDPQYYRNQSGYDMCTMPLVANSTDNMNIFDDVIFTNGFRPEQIFWSCHSENESCCGYECCTTTTTTIFPTTQMRRKTSTRVYSKITDRAPIVDDIYNSNPYKPHRETSSHYNVGDGIIAIVIFISVILCCGSFLVCELRRGAKLTFSSQSVDDDSQRRNFDESQPLNPPKAAVNQQTTSNFDPPSYEWCQNQSTPQN